MCITGSPLDWAGSGEIYCALKVLFSSGWTGERAEMRETGSDGAPFMRASVELQCCVCFIEVNQGREGDTGLCSCSHNGLGL